MDDALRPVDLYRRPVALHGGDLAAADAPQQLDISQTHPCEWRTDKQDCRNAAASVGRFLNDFDQFIHGRGGWAERAADLGWDTLALFGCHPTRSLDHLSGAGLLWRISGGKITAMQTDWATIEIDGVQHIVHRRPPP